MLHLGDITKISGYTAPMVDVVIGGSPCQDLSVAGKRAGLDGYNGELTGSKAATLGVNCGLSTGRNGVVTYDARGNGDGTTVSTLTGDHENRITDYTSVVVGLDAYNQSLTGDKAHTIRSIKSDTDHIPVVVQSFNWQGAAGAGLCVEENIVNPVACTRTPAVVYALDRASFNQGKNAQYDFEVSDDGVNSPIVAKGPSAVCYSVDQGGGKSACNVTEGQAPTLTCTHGGEPAVCYWDGGQVAGTLTANNAGGSQRMPDKENFNCVIQGINGDKAGTLDSSYYKGCGMRQGVEREVVAVAQKPRYIVRRLTPLECERLQGFPDGWTDIGDWIDSKGKKHQSSDAARYKALGNSISLPNWKWILKRISACYERDATMASLFSGIGGFDLLWTQLNGEGSVLWESEIDDFPSAVCKRHFGDEDTGEKGDFYEAILGRNKTEDV